MIDLHKLLSSLTSSRVHFWNHSSDWLVSKCALVCTAFLSLTRSALPNHGLLAAANNYRQSRLFQFTLTDENRQLLATSNAVDDRPPYQIRFYCSQYNGNTSNLLVELPSVCELKVNDTVIQGSVRSIYYDQLASMYWSNCNRSCVVWKESLALSTPQISL